MKMRDLEARTEVNRETIRVYMRHGVVPQPVRPKPNVADYDESHVRAVQAVRDLQRNSGLTLRQIKDVLSGQPNDRRVDASAFHNLEELVAARMGQSGKPILLSTLAEKWPEAERDAKAMAANGVVAIVQTRAGPALSITDSRLVTIWSEMREVGFTEKLGFSPEILSFYVQPAQAIAEEEAQRFLAATEGRISEEQAADMLQEALKLMLDFWGLIRMKVLLQRFQEHKEAIAQSTLQKKPAASRKRA